MCYFAKPNVAVPATPSPLGLKLKSKDSKRTYSPRYDSECKDCEKRSSSSVKQNEPVEILPHLYIGSEIHASQKELLQRLGITSIVNVSRNIPNFFEGTFYYKSIPVDDTYNADIGSWFEEAAEFIGEKKFPVFKPKIKLCKTWFNSLLIYFTRKKVYTDENKLDGALSIIS